MSDLIERLRRCSKAWAAHGYEPDALVTHEAADLLEANAAEIKALKEVLQRRGKSALPELAALRAKNEKLRDALKRLASPEAFVISRPTNEEDRARMIFAEQALAAVEQSEAGEKTHVRTHDRRSIVCHAEGDTCLGCNHYYGKADVCKYAPIQSKGSPDAWIPRK